MCAPARAIVHVRAGVCVRASARARVRVRVRVLSCACVCEFVCVRVCVRASVRARARVCVHVCARVRACVRACVCLRECMSVHALPACGTWCMRAVRAVGWLGGWVNVCVAGKEGGILWGGRGGAARDGTGWLRVRPVL